MGKFRITTTERAEDTAERPTSCAIPGPRSRAGIGGCMITQCAGRVTPGYKTQPKGVSPLADGEGHE